MVFCSKMLRSLQTSKNSTSTLSCLLVPAVAMIKGMWRRHIQLLKPLGSWICFLFLSDTHVCSVVPLSHISGTYSHKFKSLFIDLTQTWVRLIDVSPEYKSGSIFFSFFSTVRLISQTKPLKCVDNCST